MKKTISCFLISGLIATAGLISSAQASVKVFANDQSFTTEKIFTLPLETYKYTGPEEIKEARPQYYHYFNVGVTNPQQIDVGLLNGEMRSGSAGSSYMLAVVNATGSMTHIVYDAAGTCSTAIVGNIVSGKIQFKTTSGMKKTPTGNLNSGEDLNTTDKVAVFTSTALTTPAGVAAAVADAHNMKGTYGFSFRPNASLNDGDELTLASYTNGGVTADATTTFAKLEKGYELNISKLANAVIDVAVDRKKFTGNGTTDTVTAKIAQITGKQLVDKTTPFGKAYAKLPLVLEPSEVTGILRIKNNASEVITPVSDEYSQDMTAIDTNYTFTIEVTGTTVLQTRTFGLDAKSTAATGYRQITYADDKAAGAWSLNGFQAVIPYFNTNDDFGTQVIINSTASTSSDVIFDVLSSTDSAVQSDLSSYQNKKVTGKETVASKGTVLFNTSEIRTALGLPLKDASGSYLRNSVQVTVTAPKGSVSAQAIQQDGTMGKRTQPLLKSLGLTGTVGGSELSATGNYLTE